MNPVIETILQHRSIRNFADRPLSDEQIRTIVECAQAASTSSFIQAYSIIGVKNKEVKRKLAELAGNQSYVENNGHFFVFCADLYRHQIIGEMEHMDVSASLESTEKFMVSLIDTALAAQNAVIAAESMGLGVCYIGGLRNHLPEVCELLNIPQRVIPLFGIAVGYPAQAPDKKPRLPFQHIYHEETYRQDRTEFEKQLGQYNEVISSYYQKRTNGKRDDTWTEQMANMLSKPVRMYMKEFVESQGFNLK
ncbi:oxygen-insensitive NADPH nitroreductase [Anoxybacillus rupiensis]|jgi:FMN reductase (NADPH)|uniref:Oxygen-insensitive NADPH nitroreductase n=1 Tax=Anoxybacteroides rupiense TaxID=311460 RepID=A0ABT5W8A5_9BACL|nr:MULTISPECIES: oxygen-insensitive NADPH nitroreductase [Anoxybacillus]MBS2771933.1 oxygen-insensitive NADPH nitroreductase [Anoxybacillus rupiensis]MDE8565089.1 oxygen-insensitive NADPH nitroreductase [Anoxybacillus rupiensis]QHC02770.1 oxygen-insensitive NADPH nitroreductase [Anoxybacillus sp. PDR2]